jgi:lactoylglutathione lyase
MEMRYMKIEHIALWAKDIEVLKSFYEKYFNAKSNSKYSNPSKMFSSYFLSFESDTRLEIMQMPSIPDAKDNQNDQFIGYTHLVISVGSEDKVNALTSKLSDDGFKVLDGPRRTGDGYYESIVLDPENNRIEITI